MTSDAGRTRADKDGQDQDAVLLRQLLICARIGLVGAALSRRAAATEDLAELMAHFDGGVGDLTRRVHRLIRNVADAWARMPEGRLADAAGALLGLDSDSASSVSAPWSQREAAAAERWASGTRVDTFNRRARQQVFAELLFRLREPKPATPQPTVWGNLPRVPKELEGGDHPTISLEIDTEISCAHRQVIRSHWRRTVRPVKSGLVRLTLTTHDDTLQTVEPQRAGDCVAVEGPLGTDRSGGHVWGLILREPSVVGRPVMLDYVKTFDADTGLPPSGYISEGVREEHPTEWLTIDCRFLDDGEPPIRGVRFVQPRGLLPRLTGTTWPLRLSSRKLAAQFDPMIGHSSHGIYWWFEKDTFWPDLGPGR